MTGPSRLWRMLGATQSVFNVTSDGDESINVLDHHMTSITITRGSADSTVGVQDHTIEVDTVVALGDRTDQAIRCELTDYGANLITSKTGGVASSIKARYFGRVGRQTIRDAGGLHDGSKWWASLYGSKWQAQLENSDRVGNQIDGQTVHYLMDHFMNPEYSNLDHMPPAQFPVPVEDYGRMHNSYDLGEAKLTYSDFIGKYFDTPGYYVQNLRIGADRVYTLLHRWNIALARLETYYPLTRSQVIAPTEWDQPRQDRPHNHQIFWHSPAGDSDAMTGPDINDVRIPLTVHDASHIHWDDVHQPIHRIHAAYGAERIDMGYRLPSVRIDLLRLIESSNLADQRQALQLLLMEMGDPVFLSGDWHASLDGMLFAHGIKETITPDSWEIELNLTPSIATVGEWSPPIPPKIWDSAHYPWSDETNTWNSI